jgi:cellulose/xylan binding protein with CBM9 domain
MQQVETILAPHVETELSPDQFQDPAWAKAPPIQIARKWSGEDAPVSRHAEARIVWSAESLAVRFVCRQDEPLIVHSNPQLDKKTIGVWDRDVCELFIAPDASAPGRYFEFQAAPTGEWVDLAINFTAAGRETDFEFHSGMSAAAIVSEGVTTITMRIPWSDLIPKPQRGDAWRVNLFRCVGTGNERYLAWRPTYTSEPNFHVPEVFGWLRFV